MRSFAARTSQLLVVHWLFCDELVLSSFWVPAKRLALAVRNLIQVEVRRSTLCCSAGLFSQTTEANSNRRVFFLGPRPAFGYICFWDRQPRATTQRIVSPPFSPLDSPLVLYSAKRLRLRWNIIAVLENDKTVQLQLWLTGFAFHRFSVLRSSYAAELDPLYTLPVRSRK